MTTNDERANVDRQSRTRDREDVTVREPRARTRTRDYPPATRGDREGRQR